LKKPPEIPESLTAHNHTRIDNYYWMRNPDSEELEDYIASENKMTQKWLNKHKNLYNNLFEEIKSRIPQTDESVPFKFDDYFYYSRIEEQHEYPVYCRKHLTLDNPEEILLDVNKLAKGSKFFSLGMFEVNAAENILAYSVDTLGNQIYTLYFKNLKTGKKLAYSLSNICAFSWSNLDNMIYYSVYDKAQRPYKIYQHVLGQPQKQDKPIFHEKNKRYACSISRTQSKVYMLIDTDSNNASETWFFDANTKDAQPLLLQKRKRKLEYHTDHYQGFFYILTNHNAPNFRLVKTPVQNPEIQFWEEIIPHKKDTLLEDFHLFQNYLVLEERKNGLPQIHIIPLDNRKDYYLNFPDPTYIATIGDNYCYDTEILRYVYSSLNTPTCVFDFNMKTKTQTLLKQDQILPQFLPENYKSEYVFVSTSDRKKVPVSLVYQSDLFQKNGNNPMLLNAYGAYGEISEPIFSRAILPILDRGFVYAIAHVRGGEEMGRNWYEQGKLLNKKNSFTDLIAVARFLTKNKYTQSNLMFLEGGSAGGMLMAAVINQDPDICLAAYLQVPFLDVLTTMLDKDLPLTIGEYDEWGNPNILKFYQYILSYSPYDNLQARDYPNMLITTSMNDTNVPYWEAVKYIAKLRSLKKDKNLQLLSVDPDSGHQGASGRNDSYREIALEYTFFLSLLNKS